MATEADLDAPEHEPPTHEPEPPDLEREALGAQYREAKGSIVPHRRRQAAAELELGRRRRRHREDHPDVVAALEAVRQAVVDVAWCKAVTVAAGELYKGEPFADVLERNEAHRDRRPRRRAAR